MSDNRTTATGFTLVEVLIVMAVLSMLGAIVIPSITRLPELTRSAVCKNSLKQVGALMHTLGATNRKGGTGLGSGPRLPMAYDWDLLIHESGNSEFLFCVSAEQPEVDYSATLRDAWVRQDGSSMSVSPGVVYTYLYDALFEGEVNDPQLHYMYQGEDNGAAEGGWDWVVALNDGNLPEDNQAFVAIATCAAMLITFTDDYVEYKPLGHSPSWMSGSSHWVGQGDPYDEDEWGEDVLVRLTGQNYAAVNPPVRVDTYHETSYGMSDLVPTVAYRLDQLMLVEYNQPILYLQPGDPISHDPFNGNLDDGEIEERHLGKANFLRVGGSVGGMTKVELAREYQNLSDRESLWAK